MKNRERLGSRLGFIMLSAGCAIGCGNVWKFPYMVGNNGGGIFVLFYLLFLAIMGVPILSMELAIGRGSKKSTVRAYGELEKKGQKWHIHGYVALIGNYLLMMFYTVVAGWMLGSAISKLSEREQVIVKLRFGINMPEGREKTQKEVADLLGISQSYISRLEKRIMKRLRKEIARYE